MNRFALIFVSGCVLALCIITSSCASFYAFQGKPNKDLSGPIPETAFIYHCSADSLGKAIEEAEKRGYMHLLDYSIEQKSAWLLPFFWTTYTMVFASYDETKDIRKDQ